MTIWRKSSYSFSNGNCVQVRSGWRKPSHSFANSNCVEATTPAGAVLVRDSKNPHSGYLEFAPDAWRDFVAVLKSEDAARTA